VRFIAACSEDVAKSTIDVFRLTDTWNWWVEYV